MNLVLWFEGEIILSIQISRICKPQLENVVTFGHENEVL
jgi:hypothetical protein